MWTATQEPVGFLTAENCGEVLLGVSREVFERTAFLGQGNAALDASPDLEKRVAALATSGEEDVSFSQVERRLKDWLNRRRSNSRNGLIPKLEEELDGLEARQAQQEGLLRQAPGRPAGEGGSRGPKGRAGGPAPGPLRRPAGPAEPAPAQAQADVETAQACTDCP